MNPSASSAVLKRLDRELWIITAAADARHGGLVATFVSSASIVDELPRVLVGLAKHHFTCELIERSQAFAMHLLREEHLAWVWHFGIATGRDVDKLAGLDWHPGGTGSPLLADALGWLECRVEATMDTGDRVIYLAEVLDGQLAQPDVPHLTFQRLFQLAPAEQLQQLRALHDRDRVTDAAAIRAWRQARGG
ncbi:MAG: flavin reductase family protein [Gemmataceae bacterium]